jgi:hypothetical protein
MRRDNAALDVIRDLGEVAENSGTPSSGDDDLSAGMAAFELPDQ